MSVEGTGMLNLEEIAAILRDNGNIEQCELSLVALHECILDIPDYKINLRRATLVVPEEKRNGPIHERRSKQVTESPEWKQSW